MMRFWDKSSWKCLLILAQDENEVRYDACRSGLQKLAGSFGQQVATMRLVKEKTWVAVGRRRIGMERTAWMLRKAIRVQEAFLCPRIDRGLVFFDK